MALVEHQNVAHARDLLARDVAAEDQRVQQLTAELMRERRDVEELTRGVLGFLASLALADEVEREQREAMEAEVRLREALTSRDGLRAQLASLDARLAARSRAQLEADLRAAREAKEAALLEYGGPESAQLQDLAIRIESIDIELVPLEDAVTTGSAAIAGLSQILTLLDRARAAPDRGADHVNEAKGIVGDTQARITLFQRAVDALAAPDDVTPPYANAISDEDRQPFADAWIKRLFGSGDRSNRLEHAHAALLDRLHRIQAQLAPVRTRRDELAVRRAEIRARYDQLLLPT